MERRTTANGNVWVKKKLRMLTTCDYKKVLDIIDVAYAVPNRAQIFQAVFEKLNKLVGINSAAYIPWSAHTNNFQFQGSVVFNASAQVLRVYLDQFSAIDPYVKSGNHLTNPLNTAVKVTDFMPASRYAETLYAREFAPLIPCFYEMNAVLGVQGVPIGGIALHRKRRERDFRERDRKIMNLLLPHLARAVHNIGLMDDITSTLSVGMIVLDGKNMVLSINEEARRALNGRPISSLSDPETSPDAGIYRTEAGSYHLKSVCVRPWRKERIILLQPTPDDHKLGSKLGEYGLTARQQEVVRLVSRGFSNLEVAERLFIEEQTVKDHLHDVFGKMKIRRRSELAAKVLGLC